MLIESFTQIAQGSPPAEKRAEKIRMIRDKEKKWMTVKGMAEYCLVSRGTVRRWIKEGKISATVLPSGHYRVSIADFRDFLERYEMPVREELFESKSI